jgi:hypothetical protein
MSELVDPREEKACQLRASGKSQCYAYGAAFEVPEGSKANNSSRFFRRSEISTRVDEIKHRRAVLADLDEAWVLRQLKAIAKNGELIGNSSLDDYFVRNAAGERTGVDLNQVPAEKMAALEEVTVEQVVEGRGDGKQTIRRTKIKLRSATATIQANELLGKWLGMWKDKVGLTCGSGVGAAALEVYWKGSPMESQVDPI